MEDDRTIAELWETEEGAAAAYVWVTFTDVEGYRVVIGDVRDMAVAQEFQRQGIGTDILEYVDSVARRIGAAVLRSETGIENVASHALHNRCGFRIYRVGYEKVLDQSAAGRIAEQSAGADGEAGAAQL